MATFAAIDFETACGDRNSACAVGLSIVDDDENTLGRSWLIRPPDNMYDSFNIGIHGIQPADTSDTPNFNQVWPEVAALIGDRLVIAHHTSFDIFVLQHASAHWSYTPPSLKFACTYRLAKATWSQRWSYRLNHLAEDFNIDLLHHDALSDANAAAQLALHICHYHNAATVEDVSASLGYRLGELTSTGYRPFTNTKTASYRGRHRPPADLRILQATGAIDDRHSLFGTQIAFTGKLETMSRSEAAQAAVDVGAKAQNGVTRSTDYLVMGITNLKVVGSDGMSKKLRKAVEIAESGQNLEIIDEGEFRELLG